jgi:FKBP-type peptidyl-prolyl cis-trans isomerase FklB
MSVAKYYKTEGLDSLDIEVFTQAVKDVYNNDSLKLSETEANMLLQTYFQNLKSKKFEGNKKKGADFLAENAKKEGVVTLPNGLQYQVMTEGKGEKPKLTDTVKTHYHGTLIDGTVFDSSVQRGEPISFPVNGVIKGWTEALQLMPVGSKWKLFVPYDLAYGERGAGGAIGPYETLIFEVELLAIEKQK